MSKFLKYDFNKIIIKRGAYIPDSHGVINTEQAIIRKGLVEILARDKSLKIEAGQPDENNIKTHEPIWVS